VFLSHRNNFRIESIGLGSVFHDPGMHFQIDVGIHGFIDDPFEKGRLVNGGVCANAPLDLFNILIVYLRHGSHETIADLRHQMLVITVKTTAEIQKIPVGRDTGEQMAELLIEIGWDVGVIFQNKNGFISVLDGCFPDRVMAQRASLDSVGAEVIAEACETLIRHDILSQNGRKAFEIDACHAEFIADFLHPFCILIEIDYIHLVDNRVDIGHLV
jgi:hypothetical protein